MRNIEALALALRQNQLSADEFQAILWKLSQPDRTALFQLLDELTRA
jgi:hypothetical protein